MRKWRGQREITLSKDFAWKLRTRWYLQEDLGSRKDFTLFVFVAFNGCDSQGNGDLLAEDDLFPGSGEGISFLLGEGHFSGCGEGGLEQERLGSRTQLGHCCQRGWECCYP